MGYQIGVLLHLAPTTVCPYFLSPIAPSDSLSGCPQSGLYIWLGWGYPQCSFLMFISISPHVDWSHLACSPPHESNIFHLMWIISQNSCEVTPFPSINKVLCESPIMAPENATEFKVKWSTPRWVSNWSHALAIFWSPKAAHKVFRCQNEKEFFILNHVSSLF